MTTRSTIPANLTALFNLATSTLTDWQVIDGPPLNNLKTNYALIGYNNDNPAVEGDQSISDYGVVNSHETYNIVNVLCAWQGGSSYQTVRDQVFDGLSLVSAALEADPQLGGACMLAQLTQTSLLPTRGSNRTTAWLTWVVNIQAQRQQ